MDAHQLFSAQWIPTDFHNILLCIWYLKSNDYFPLIVLWALMFFFLSSRDWRPSSHCALKTALFFNWLQAFAQLPVQEPDSLVLSWDMAYPIELLLSNGWLARSWIPPASDDLKMTEAWLFIPVQQSFIPGLFERFREFLGRENRWYSTWNLFF